MVAKSGTVREDRNLADVVQSEEETRGIFICCKGRRNPTGTPPPSHSRIHVSEHFKLVVYSCWVVIVVTAYWKNCSAAFSSCSEPAFLAFPQANSAMGPGLYVRCTAFKY